MMCKFLWLTGSMRGSKNLMVVEISYNMPYTVETVFFLTIGLFYRILLHKLFNSLLELIFHRFFSNYSNMQGNG